MIRFFAASVFFWGLVGSASHVAATVSPGDLLLDARTRAQFTAAWSPSTVTVHYHPPLAPGQDERYRTALSVRGAIFEHDGDVQVVAPTSHLAGATWAELELFDGRRIPARVQPPAGNARDIPLMRVIADRPLTGIVPLTWASPKVATDGLRVWGVGLTTAIMPGGKPVAALIDAALGKAVEAPLERFRYVGVGGVDGLALLDRDGAVVCVVFRGVPGMRDRSLCTPQQAAFSVPASKPVKTTPMKIRTYGARKAEP